MSEVFEFCLGDHRQCTIYHQIVIHVEHSSTSRLSKAG
jgi:hypothetical protein